MTNGLLTRIHNAFSVGKKSKKTKTANEINILKRSQIFVFIIIIIVTLFLAATWAGNGFSTQIVGESPDFTVNIDSPKDMQVYYYGDNIQMSGGVIGDTLQKVYVWDTDFNVAVTATLTATKWGVTLYASDMSIGQHTLAVQAQGANGEWSPIATVILQIKGSTGVSHQYISDRFGPLAPVFRPIEDIIKGLSLTTTQGTGDNDLNGDNINDVFERNPVTPRYDPMNLPLTFIIVFAILAVLIYFLSIYVYKYMQRRQMYKDMMARRIITHPARRQWYLNLKALNNKELQRQLAVERSTNRAERSRLMEQVSKLQEEETNLRKEKPVKILIMPKVGPRPQPTQQVRPKIKFIRNVKPSSQNINMNRNRSLNTYGRRKRKK